MNVGWRGRRPCRTGEALVALRGRVLAAVSMLAASTLAVVAVSSEGERTRPRTQQATCQHRRPSGESASDRAPDPDQEGASGSQSPRDAMYQGPKAVESACKDRPGLPE